MKKTILLFLITLIVISCSDNSSTTGNVSLKATAVSTTGKTSLTGRIAASSTVVITDFKFNIGNIKFETDEADDRHDIDPSHEDVKLTGPFLLDLLDINKPLSQFITSLNVPNAQYEEIKFKFTKSLVEGEMLGKTFLIKGTINDIPFVIWSAEDTETELDFSDSTKDFTVNDNNLNLNIKVQLDALMEKLTELSNNGLLVDTDADGTIEITTSAEDGHSSIGRILKELLEDETHLDDKD